MWGRKTLMVLAAGASMATACAHPNQLANEDDGIPSAPIGVRIENRNFSDMNVFAVSGGMARRLGMVIGSSDGTFSQ